MRLEVFKDFTLIDMIYSYSGFTHERRYAGAGGFTLTLNDLENASSLERDFYLMMNNDAYLIEGRHKFKNERGEIEFEVTGRSLNSILDRRCVVAFTLEASKTYEEQMYSLVDQLFINPTDSNRKVACMRSAQSKGLAEKPAENLLFESKNVLEIFTEIGKLTDIGFRINYIPEEMALEFEVYQGRNVSDVVFFAEEFGNVSEVELYEEGQEFRNVGYLNNDGRLTERGAGVGLERRECILDGTNISDLENMLSNKAVLISCEGTILDTEQFTYREDWNLGDTVSFHDKTIGFEVVRPIIEIKETFTDKKEIDVVFGDKIPTIFDKLK